MTPTRLITETYRPAEGFYASEVNSPRRLPVMTFLPAGYEPEYAYPLVVFFHGRGSGERQIMRLAPRLSRRNYICIGLRGSDVVIRRDDGKVGYSWESEGRTDSIAEEYVFRAVEHACEMFCIHQERIYLAGFCEGATLAYRLGLSYPQKFAGVIALNGALPRGGPLLRYPEIRRLRILMGHGIANVKVPLSQAKRDYRLLYSAGLPVELRTYLTTQRLHPSMLRDIDRWIMESVASAAF